MSVLNNYAKEWIKKSMGAIVMGRALPQFKNSPHRITVNYADKGADKYITMDKVLYDELKGMINKPARDPMADAAKFIEKARAEAKELAKKVTKSDVKLLTVQDKARMNGIAIDIKPTQTTLTNFEGKTALKGYAKSYLIKNFPEAEDFPNSHLPFNLVGEYTRPICKDLIMKSLNKLKGLKVKITVKAVFYNLSKRFDFEPEDSQYMDPNYVEGDTITDAYFNSKTKHITNAHEISDILTIMNKDIEIGIDNFLTQGSGWNYLKTEQYIISIVKYNPLRGKSYIKLPKWIIDKRAVLNIENKDNQCFKWCVLAALHPSNDKHPERVTKYKQYEADINDDDVEYPMAINKIAKFEQANEISINVFTNDNKCIVPLSITKQKKNKHINLLLISNGDKSHYCLINNMSRLLCNQFNKHDGKKYFCDHCLLGFQSEAVLKKHRDNGCVDRDPCKVILPTVENNTIQFNNYNRKLKIPVVIYYDSESNLKTIEPNDDDEDKKTVSYQEHKPYSFCYKVVSEFPQLFVMYPELKSKVIIRGDDCVDNFLRSLKAVEAKINTFLDTNVAMILTDEDKKNHKTATNCHICEQSLKPTKKIDNFDYKVVRDHCHITGKYRGAAHKSCRDEYNYKKMKIPIIAHNSKKYDAHFIAPKLSIIKGKKSCIAKNIQEYISFSCDRLQFTDSFGFLAEGLAKLANNLTKNQFINLQEEYNDYDLLTRKGIYPYDYFTNNNKYEETKLPTIDKFYNKLNNENVSQADYAHALKVWEHYECKTLRDYHDLYLATDVLLLADVFEQFRKVTINNFGLDPLQYCTSPGLAWDACLKMTGAKLDLITDIDQYLFIEGGLRGGMSMIVNRYSKANNKEMKDYDPTKPNKWISYLDMNNLYGAAMRDYLPIGKFKWIEPRTWTADKILEQKDEQDTGYIFEVDLNYPEKLHDIHMNYPLAPEKLTITNDMLSPYATHIKQELKLSDGKVEKLVPNLNNKTKYVTHYRNLKLYISLGMELTKVHRVLQYNQGPWMRKFIDFNTEKRKLASIAKNKFEENLYKLYNNSCFGKTMENVRNRINVQLIDSPEKLEKLARKPLYEGCKIFNDKDGENLVAVHMTKSKVFLNKPIAVGFSVLEISKIFMYDFYYNTLVKKYGDKVKLLMTDTDSMMLEIETEDWMKDIDSMRDKFDLSNFDKKHALYDNTNEKVVKKMKSETGEIAISEYVGLRAKMYSLSYSDKEKMTAKGVKSNYVKQNIRHEDYKRCLFADNVNDMKQTATFNLIRSVNHNVKSITVTKSSLVAYDDKMYLIDNITTLPYGHYKINK